MTGGTASVYVTFDGKAVGEAQANGVIAAMKANGTYKGGTVAELWGGQTDQNAFWFKSGNDAVLNPLFKSGKIKKGPQQFVPDWDANNAATDLQPDARQDEQQDRGRASRRTTTSPAPSIADLKAKHLKPIPLSGQDATVAGRPVHHLRLADGHGLQVRARRGERRGRGCGRAPQGQEAEDERRPGRTASKKEPTLRASGRSGSRRPTTTRLFTDKFLKKSDVCVGDVQAVLQVGRSTRVTVEAPLGAPPPLFW